MLKTLKGTPEDVRLVFVLLSTSKADLFAPSPTSEVAQPPDHIGCRRFRHCNREGTMGFAERVEWDVGGAGLGEEDGGLAF